MADQHDFTVRVEHLESMAKYLEIDSENLGNASIEYTNSIPDQSVAILGTDHTDTLYSQFEAKYNDMSSNFFNVLEDLSENLRLSSKALAEIARRYRAADQNAARNFTAIAQGMGEK